jgi:ubiquitin-protein ligase
VRLKNELRLLKENSKEDQYYFEFDSETLEFLGFVKGPEGSLYEGYYFLVKIELGNEFPIKPLKCYF